MCGQERMGDRDGEPTPPSVYGNGERGRARGPSAAVRSGYRPRPIGRDGRVRRLDNSHARRLAQEAIAARPQASLREIARVSGLSPMTVRDVRTRMRRNEPLEPPVRPAAGPANDGTGPGRAALLESP